MTLKPHYVITQSHMQVGGNKYHERKCAKNTTKDTNWPNFQSITNKSVKFVFCVNQKHCKDRDESALLTTMKHPLQHHSKVFLHASTNVGPMSPTTGKMCCILSDANKSIN